MRNEKQTENIMNVIYLICVIFAFCTSVISFSWDSCGSSSDPVKINKLRVTENDGELLITGKANVGVNLTSPIKGKLQIRRKSFWGWTKIPCVNNFGSCTYNDICKFGQNYENRKCPENFSDNNLPCHCPVIKGSYSLKKFQIDLQRFSGLASGQYQIKGVLSSRNKQLLCLKAEITIDT